MAREYVFGYGSLLERSSGDEGGEAPVLCEVRNYRRVWNVAMDNSRTIPGYKYYVDPATGERPDHFVTFLNIVPDAEAAVNGALFEVSDAQLERLDRRERNYERIDVTAGVSRAVEGTVWAYAGRESAVHRFQLGHRTDRAVIPRGYYERVLRDFASFGRDAQRRYTELTDPPPCPIVDLRRVDLPATAPALNRSRPRSGG